MNGPGAGKTIRFILVMDRNVDDRFNVSMLLQKFGYNVGTAHTVDEAMEFMNVSPPAGIVSEGGPLGLSLLMKLRKDERFSDVPAIFLAASPDRVLEERFRRGECSACLRKPVDTEEFYRAVQTAVEKGPRRYIRVATSLRATLEDGFAAEGLATVLSESGMFFRSLDPRPVNTRVRVTIDLKGRSVTAGAVVLYICTFNEGPFKEPGMGLKFIAISDEDRAFIRSFILEQVESGLSRKHP